MNFTLYKNNLPYASRHEDVKTWQAYQKEDARVHTLFEKDLFEDLGITDHPKKGLLFSKAWEMGHSSGYHEVYTVAQDLVELIL
jgi:hypothetical protein